MGLCGGEGEGLRLKSLVFFHPSVAMPKKASPAPESIETPDSYEAAVAELEQLAVRMESGQLPLNDMLTGYRRASVLLAYCREQLDGVEAQIKVLDGETLKKWAQE